MSRARKPAVQDRQSLERCNLKWWNVPEFWYITRKNKWQHKYHKLVLYYKKTICGVSVTFPYPKDFRYLIVGLAVSEDEINGSLDVAVLEVMPSLLVVQGVLSTIESDAVELGFVSRNAEGHCLLPNSSARRGRGGVLETTKFIISIITFKMLQEVSRI